ncbi:MAG TPA: nickel pincer cofactor biosynthesis protein LarC [Gemmataceae bacterium]|nr:nickel pincer cofactor biosynthesis protein LarC [Gemmataceae bacterium]
MAHFDCFSGISGDMTVAALLDAGVPFEPIRAGIASLGLPVQLEVEKVVKCGLAATYFHVEAPLETEHRHLPEIEAILQRGQLSVRQRDLALAIFRRLAHAEAVVHGIAVDKVHFHEVGALDSIADIVGAAIGLDLLNVDRFTSSPVAVGGGMVKCAHGLMPVPAPATAELLKGVPLRSSPIQAELATPTGAAILSTIVKEWVEQPTLTIERIGHGAGKRNFPEQPNLLRVFVGASADREPGGLESDQIVVLETNLDNISAEVIGYCFELLFAAGALDVFTTPIQMKKNRPGVLLSVLAPVNSTAALEEIVFRETATLGVRRYVTQRHKLFRRECIVQTPWGQVRGKLAWREGGAPAFAPEYDDCARLARANNVALREVYRQARKAHDDSHV